MEFVKKRARQPCFIALAAFISWALIQPAAAQFTFTTNNGAITITEYTGSGSSAAIPATTNGYPVVAIESSAFANNDTITNVIIPNSVTNIGDFAFENSSLSSITIPASVTGIGQDAFGSCYYLLAISVNATNPIYSSLNGALFDKKQDLLIQYPLALANTGYTVPATVAVIADDAFYAAPNLTTVTFPNSVDSIGDDAFAYCSYLTSVYFYGNAPSAGTFAFYDTGSGNGVTAYYLPGTTGWSGFSSALGHSLAALRFWYLPGPEFLYFEPSRGVHNNQMQFTISWATNATIVVDACTNIAYPFWVSIATNAITAPIGTASFSDPQWASFLKRAYRVHSQ